MDPNIQTPSPNPVVPTVSAPAPKKSSPNKIILGISGLIILTILLGAGYYLSSRTAAPAASPSPTPETTPETSTAPTESPSLTPTPTKTPRPTATPTPRPSSTPTPSPTTTPTATPVSLSTTQNATSSLDGFESSNGGGNTTIDIRAGRNSNLTTRGFVSFDLPSLPTGAVIDKATLRLYQYSVVGSPYGVSGNLLVDHVNYGGTLNNSAYSAAPLSTGIGGLTSSASIGWKELVVTDSFKDDRANSRSRSQYRLRFTTETVGGDVTGDFAYLESAENTGATGNTPQLVILYH